MIGDYKGGDETVLATALEVFDTLSNTMAEYESAVSPRAAANTQSDLGTNRTGKHPTASALNHRLSCGYSVKPCMHLIFQKHNYFCFFGRQLLKH